MAIHQRDRTFLKLITEIDIDTIPLEFIKNITCHLSDGTSVTINEADLVDKADAKDLPSLLKSLDFYDQMSDLKITIDFNKVEKDVESKVAKLLKVAPK